MKKRIPAVILAAILALSAAACGQEQTAGSGSTGQAPSGEAAFYTDQDITPGGLSDFEEFGLGQMRVIDGRVQAYGYGYDEAYNLTDFICSFSPDGSDFTMHELDTGDMSIAYTAIDNEGSYYVLLAGYSGQAEEADTADTAAAEEDPEDFEGEESMVYTLEKWDADGKTLFSVPVGSAGSGGPEVYAGVSDMEFVDGVGIFMTDEEGAACYSLEDGSLVARVEGTEELEEAQMTLMGSGDILVSYFDGTGQAYGVIRTGTGKPVMEDTEVGTTDLLSYTLFTGIGSDLLLQDSAGIYSFSLGDEKPSRIVRFLDADMDVAFINTVTAMEDGSILMMCGSNDASYGIHCLTPSDTDLKAGRTEITLGCYYIEPEVRRKVIEFNKTSTDYNITIKDYSDYDDLGEEGENSSDLTGGEEALNNDIISGSLPDILILPQTLDAQNYTSKGVFEDLAPYMEKDEEIGSGSYLTNIFEACNPDDGTYILVPSFSIIGIFGRTEDVGEDHNISVAELMALADERGVEYKNIFGQDVRSMVFYEALQLNGAQFVNVAEGSSNFDSPEFKAILELASKFPEEIDYTEVDEMEDTTDWYRSGRSLLQERYMGSFNDFNTAEKGDFGSEICAMGFPSETAAGPAVVPDQQITMSAASKNKEGAWQFIRLFLLDDYQSQIAASFPVSRTALEALAQEAMTQQYVENENGEQVPDELIYYVGGQEVVISVMTEEETSRVMDILTSADHRLYMDGDVLAIVEEEAAAYFAGEKTAEETAQIIQSRVQIYISESN